jgi:hypothetical protein
LPYLKAFGLSNSGGTFGLTNMGRNHTIEVPVSKEEKEKIKRRAVESGMKTATFLRWVGLNARISVEYQPN